MKLFFSTVLVAAPGGEVLTYWESGHPDEYDIWELITRDARYRKAAELLEESVEVRVSHYIYETESPGPDAHAEQSHFDLLDAITSWPAGTGAPGLSTGGCQQGTNIQPSPGTMMEG